MPVFVSASLCSRRMLLHDQLYRAWHANTVRASIVDLHAVVRASLHSACAVIHSLLPTIALFLICSSKLSMACMRTPCALRLLICMLLLALDSILCVQSSTLNFSRPLFFCSYSIHTMGLCLGGERSLSRPNETVTTSPTARACRVLFHVVLYQITMGLSQGDSNCLHFMR